MSDSDATPDGVNVTELSDATPTDNDQPPPLPPEIPEPCWPPSVLKAFQDFKTTLDKLQVEERTHLVFQIMGGVRDQERPVALDALWRAGQRLHVHEGPRHQSHQVLPAPAPPAPRLPHAAPGWAA